MKTKNIKTLLDAGLGIEMISKLNELQINVLANKFENQKINEETKQTVTNVTYDPNNPTDQKSLAQRGIHVDPSNKKISMTLGSTGEVKEDETLDVVQDPDATSDGMPTTESEISEKFESKSQQKFFWSKCKQSKDENSKWCKWADEFSKKTKNFKKLPEKLHPEKSVKVRKENYEQFLEDSIVEMVEKYINPTMTKSQLINSINERTKKSESFMLNKPKKNSMFSQDEGKEMKTPITKMSSIGEDTKTAPAKPGTKEREKTKEPGRKNPFQPKHKPAPKARKEYNEQTTAPVKPGTKERETTKNPGKKNPFQPKHNPAPKAGEKKIPNWLSWDKLGINLK